ncbi:patatin-like phospholipase family protein [Novosphingobium rosa]|uniref:patatin-like phospholipase family protein n=1 Tax=Novosphingobium rosa TaxID=76978 RepID=UPI00082D6223|nr:patatin-like phospholipase family protein [Novosphingobium rosa]
MIRYSFGLLSALALAGCAIAPPRVPYTLADLAAGQVIDGDPVRFWAKGDDQAYGAWRSKVLAQRQAASMPLPSTVLALSGGSDKGAYSAGVLNAWSRQGGRPSFDIVTGVSTGSLIAPFAFLGEQEDGELKAIYTGVSRKDIYHQRILSGLFGGPSLMSTRPLQALIARHITPALLDRIAVQHRRGRRLLVMTTNLDAERGVIWDMGAIAASGAPDRLSLFRQVLLASASIPGVFPPVLIHSEAHGHRFAEMHVDGGTVSGFFVLPRAMLSAAAQSPRVNGTIYVFYNGRLEPEFELVKPKTFDVVGRALATVLGENDRTSLDDLKGFAREGLGTVIVCAIEKKTAHDGAPLFDTTHMREMYALGEQQTAPDGCLGRRAGP